MNVFSFEALRTIHPLILAGAFLPLFAGLLIWARFYSVFAVKGLQEITLALSKAADVGSRLEGCAPSNAGVLQQALGTPLPPPLKTAWSRMMKELTTQYKDSFLPEAKAYFDFNTLIVYPGGRKHMVTVWSSFALLAFSCLLLPIFASIIVEDQVIPGAVGIGVFTAVFLGISHAAFVLSDHIVYQKAVVAYSRFVDVFNTVLPVAGSLAGPAMLLEATRRNQETFVASTNLIVERFDGFSEVTVLPALKETAELLVNQTLVPAVGRIESSLADAMETFSQRHDREMKTITDAFAAKLSSTLEVRINALGDMLEEVENGMEATNKQLGVNLAGMDAMISDQKTVMEKAAALLLQVSDTQNATNQNHEYLNIRVNGLADSISKFEEDTERFSVEALRFTKETGDIQKTLSTEFRDTLSRMSEEFRVAEDNLGESVKELREQYIGLSGMVSDMMSNITGRMNEAMTNAGREIAKGIQEATSDNAQAIADLTEQATRLREDYDTYFGRLEDSTKQTLDDMDFHVQNITAGITEQTGAMLKDILEQNTQVLEQYKDSTTNLLQSFDEQARSIGLYAKEMNFDITELSSNLRESVATFTAGVREGIELTVGDFDKSLAELSERLAVTVEGISDAVEHLPDAINARGGR